MNLTALFKMESLVGITAVSFLMIQLPDQVQAYIVNQCAKSHGQYFYRHDNLCCPCPPPGTEAKEGTQCHPPSHQAGGPPGYWLEKDLKSCISGTTFRTGKRPCVDLSKRKCQPCSSYRALRGEQEELYGSVIAPCTRVADAKVVCPQRHVVYDVGIGNVCANCLECCSSNPPYCDKCGVMRCPTTMTTTTTTTATTVTTTTSSRPTTTAEEDLLTTSTEAPAPQQDVVESTVTSWTEPPVGRSAETTDTSDSTVKIVLAIFAVLLLVVAMLLSYIVYRYKLFQRPPPPYRDPQQSRSTYNSSRDHQTSESHPISTPDGA